MTQEEKELLLKDLCARLLYGVKLWAKAQELAVELARIDMQKSEVTFYTCKLPAFTILDASKIERFGQQIIKPYLRPMSSMTEEECDKVEEILGDKCIFDFMANGDIILKQGFFSQHTLAKLHDYYNSIHVDYRGLIEKGLALPAPKDMYDFKSN